MDDNPKNESDIELTTDIVSAYVANNSVPAGDLSALISEVHQALSNLRDGMAAEETEPQEPAVSIRQSVKKDHLICLECGKKFVSLKRHLDARHDLTPKEYRDKWNLSYDYPITAPNYSVQRSDLAKKLGLGRKPGEKVNQRGNVK